MNNPNTKSSILNLSGGNFALITWLIAIITCVKPISFLVVIACGAILVFERNSDYVRNHVSQLLALTLIFTLIDILFYLLFGGNGGFLVFKFLRFITGFIINIIRLAIIALKISICLIGLSRAFERKDVQLPFIGEFGNALERSITPDSF